MNSKLLHIITSAVIVSLFISGCNGNHLTIPVTDHNVSYMGRIEMTDNVATLIWPGTSVKINFEGDAIYANLKDEKGENYYNIILDEDSIIVLHPDTNKQQYMLASNLTEGKHSIEIFKRTEWDRGKTDFYGFKIEGNSKLLPADAEKKLKIEFYGNSITSGYAVEDYSGNDSPDSIYTNSWNSYASIAARRLNADYQCISKGGIGVMVSWFTLIMPEMYYRLIPDDPTSKWDFSKYRPDIVVINLFQNDSWIVNMPNHSEFKNRFGTTPPDEEYIINSYKQFVTNIRGHYPEARIICMLGNMDITRKDSPWPGFVEQAVEQLNDKNIQTLFVPYKKTPGHPRIEEQQIMADKLVELIKKW